MNRILAIAAAVAVVVAPFAMAQDEAKEVKVSGKMTKVEKTVEGKAVAEYVVTTDKGVKVVLPAAKVVDGKASINYEDFVNASVDVVGKGTSSDKEVKLTEVTKVSKVEAAKEPAKEAAK